MGNKFSKKMLAGVMSLALAASVLPVGAIMQEEQAKNVPVAVAATAEKDTTKYKGFWADYAHTNQATGGAIVAYVNGNKDYKTDTVYTDVTPSYIYSTTTSSKGKVTFKSSTSKVIVAVSTSDSDSPFTEKGDKVDSTDTGVKDAKEIAKASIKNGVITVTANKKAGDVYVWVNDTNPDVKPVSIPATIKMAPKKIAMYNKFIRNDEATKAEGTTAITKANVNIKNSDGLNDRAKMIYLYGYNTTGSGSSKVDAGVFEGITFTATVDKKSAEYFTIKQESSSDPYTFRLIALKTATDSKGNAKPFTGKVTFTCDQSGAKTTFTATAVDDVVDFGWKVQTESAAKVKYTASKTEGSGPSAVYTPAKAELVVTASKNAVTAKLDVDSLSTLSGASKTTNAIAVKEITSAQADAIKTAKKFEADTKGLPKYTLTSKEKSGITASLSGTTLSLKVAKNKPLGTKGYFVVGYASGTFDIIEVTTVAE